MRIFRILGVLAVAVGIALLPACNRSTKPQVAFVTNNPEQFWTIAEAGAKKAAAEEDVELLFKRPDESTPAKQKEIIEALLAQQVSAIAVSVIAPEQQASYLNKVAAKVPLICQDNDAPGVDRLCYLGTDNYEAGKEVGKLVRKAMPEGGVVAIFVGRFDGVNARQRWQGVIDVLGGEKNARGIVAGEKDEIRIFGKYRVVGNGKHCDPFTDLNDHTVAQENAKNVVGKYADEPNLCLVGLWAYNPPAIYKAVKVAKKAGVVKIVGFDEDELTLEGIKAGHIEATVVQQPFEFGYRAVKLMAQVARGDRSGVPESGKLLVDYQVVNRDNVEQFHAKLKKLTGK